MQEFKLRLGKVLIAFSLVLIFLGVSLGIDSSNHTNVVLNDNKSYDLPNTTITTVDDSKGGKDLVDDNTNNNSGSNEVVPNDVNPGNDFTNNSNNNNNNNNTKPSVENNNPVNPPTAPTQSKEITINNIRNNIQNTYGITVKYGSETDGYVVGGYSIVSATNLDVIYNALVDLQNNLALYPINFFREIKSGGLPLTVLLIQRYSTANITGITERLKNSVIISIALDYPFAESFNHETYHYMEHYIYLKGGGYSNWNNYNPTGFSYGVYNASYVYDATFSEEAFFVNSYAQSYEYEDRASTFEYMMANTKISPLNYGKNVWKKAKVMCETIDYYFTTVNSSTTEYWERFVY